MRRSGDLIVGLLAAQMTGAAYVPLDPTAPPERLARIASVAGLDAVLVDDDHPVRLGRVRCPPRACGQPCRHRRCRRPRRRPRSESVVDALQRRVAAVSLDQTAYVIFTSGSTGEPRGVEVSHRNLAASTQARAVWYDHPPARFLVTPSIGFDSSIVGLFWPLASGGSIVLPGDDDVRDVDRIGALISRRAVTHVLMVPSLYRALLDRAPDQLAGLELVIVAGEACPQSLVDLHERVLPQVALVNEYGPTEATVWATAHRLGGDADVVAIGAVRFRVRRFGPSTHSWSRCPTGSPASC